MTWYHNFINQTIMSSNLIIFILFDKIKHKVVQTCVFCNIIFMFLKDIF